ncbi:MAG: hypothetical protein K6F53_07485 [Lachnospiraceae bacterium]|nr:hypothetical protein [Lachnospiraceae bacterium]
MGIFRDAIGEKTSYEPYKYIQTDTAVLYIGARYTYEELLEEPLLPFKMKAVIAQYILKESDAGNSLESELYHMKDSGFVYETYRQLKCRVKVMELKEKKGRGGDGEYREKVYPLERLSKIPVTEKEERGFVITELQISKLSLMGFTV